MGPAGVRGTVPASLNDFGRERSEPPRMTHARTIAAGVALIAALVGAGSPSAGQSIEAYLEMGGAIAQSFDSTNGEPVVSRTGYDCSYLRLCPNGANPTSAEAEASSAIARGFATALEIALLPPDSPRPRCAHEPDEVEGRVGLWTRFGVVSASADSAEVMVTSGCRSDRAGRTTSFTQGHLYTLRRSGSGGWEVVGTRLIWIT